MPYQYFFMVVKVSFELVLVTTKGKHFTTITTCKYVTKLSEILRG